LLSGVVVFLAIVVSLVLMARDRNRPPLPVFGFVGVIPAAFALTFFAGRIRRYRLVGGELRIEFLFRTLRFPLPGLSGVAADREAMRHAWKVYGNEGLGSISGRFRSKRLGRFRAYLTDAEHAVVLRWPDRCLVVSPQQHAFFAEAVGKRAGLSR
jgi:hypothetical protein